MLIESIRMCPFAGVADREVVFDKGMNVILGPNEYGKTTMQKALMWGLFRAARLNRRTYGKELMAIIPIGGDTARVEVVFRGARDLRYNLIKQWGANPYAQMRLNGGQLITEEAAITGIIQEAVAQELPVYERMAFAQQGALSDAFLDFSKGTDVWNSFSDLLRRFVIETEGVPVDELISALEAKATFYLDSWDAQGGRPKERKTGSGRWAKNIGEVLKAWYAFEDVRLELAQAIDTETGLDGLSARLVIHQQDLAGRVGFVLQHAALADACRRRKDMEEKLASMRAAYGSLNEVEKRWQMIAARCSELVEAVRVKKDRLPELEKEGQLVREYEKALKVKERLRLLDSLYKELDDCRRNPVLQLALGSEELGKARRLEAEKAALAGQIGASGFALTFMPTEKEETIGLYVGDSRQAVEKTLLKREPFNISGGDRLLLMHHDWSLDVRPLAVSAQANAQRLREVSAWLEDFLRRNKAQTLLEIEALLNEKKSVEMNVSMFEKRISQELGGEDVAVLRSQAAQAGTTHRELSFVEREIGEVRSFLINAEKEMERIAREEEGFAQNHGSRAEIAAHKATIQQSAEVLKQQVDEIPPLPEEFSDEAAFFAEYAKAETVIPALKDAISELRIEKAKLEERLPAESSEEIALRHAAVKVAFDQLQQTGLSYLRAASAARSLRQKFDEQTYTPTIERLDAMLTMMTAGSRTAGSLDIQTGLVDAQRGGGIPLEVLSTGTRDVFAIALKLIFAEAFIAPGNGFLVLDDPLVDLDPQRRLQAAFLLREFAAERQLIVLTCHPDHAALLHMQQSEH